MKRLIPLFIAVFMLGLCPLTSWAANKSLQLSDLGNGIIKDSKTGLMWQHGKSKKSYTAKADAEQYAKDLTLGGYNDWRLPTLAERWDLLQVFVYKNNGDITFPRSNSKYWTAATDKGTTPIKLDITCLCRGDEEVEYKTKGYVRAVRTTTP